MWCSFHLEAVIVSFSSWEVCNVLYGHFHSASFPATSSMVAPWLVIALLPPAGPGRTAATQRFWKVTPPAEAVTVSLRMTMVDSKFNLLTKAVTTSTYCLSSLVQLDGIMGLVNSTTDAVVGTIGTTTSIGPVAWPVRKSFGASLLGLVERTLASPLVEGLQGQVEFASHHPQ